MTEIIASSISLTVLSIVMANLSINASTPCGLAEFLGMASAPAFVVGAIGLATCVVLSFSYVGAEYRANIINREYGTNYTQAEVFYAGSVIETVRELDRKRVEINGDLIKGE